MDATADADASAPAPAPARSRVEVRGSLLRGLIDHIARSDGTDGAEEALRGADLIPQQVYPEVWYPMRTFEELLDAWADRADQPPEAVAFRSGHRMAAHSLRGIEDAVRYMPVEDLIVRLDAFFRIGTDSPFSVTVEDGEVHVEQSPPGGSVVCPLFHGMIEGLLDHLRLEGRLDDGDAEEIGCRARGDACCAFEIRVRTGPPRADPSRADAGTGG